MKSRVKKNAIENREDIIRNLPEFVNLIILFLGSGANIEDSLRKVICAYRNIPNEKRGYFKNQVLYILDESDRTGEGLVVLFYNFARQINIKEMTRVANVMIESKAKGTELWDRLKKESEELWLSRKRLAEGKIKLLDSKLAFPLSVTLIALILIAAAPAMLEIS